MRMQSSDWGDRRHPCRWVAETGEAGFWVPDRSEIVTQFFTRYLFFSLAVIYFSTLESVPPVLFSIEQLLDIFGLFMLVLIGVELLETVMKTYMTPGKSHYEVVLAVAIIAISRKVIILDLKEIDPIGLLGMASIIVALTLGYFLMKRAKPGNSQPDKP